VTDTLGKIDTRGKRLLQLREKLKAREGIAGYEKSCEEIEAAIARLEARQPKGYDL